MKTFIIIPSHNEEKYIEEVIKKCLVFSKNIIVVDDGSRDQTSTKAKKLIRHVLVHETNIGKGAAMKTGANFAFDKLFADAVIFLDADDQHDPKEIPSFEKALLRNDVVFGVRKMGATMPLLRFLGNKSASVLLNLMYGVYIPDIPSGYKGLTKKAYKEVLWRASGYEVETEIAVRVASKRLAFKVLEIESIYHDTDKGMTLLDGIMICWHLIQWRLGL